MEPVEPERALWRPVPHCGSKALTESACRLPPAVRLRTARPRVPPLPLPGGRAHAGPCLRRPSRSSTLDGGVTARVTCLRARARGAPGSEHRWTGEWQVPTRLQQLTEEQLLLIARRLKPSAYAAVVDAAAAASPFCCCCYRRRRRLRRDQQHTNASC